MTGSLRISTTLLLGTNLATLAIAILLRWPMIEVIVIYWLQSLVIAIFQHRKFRDVLAYLRDPARGEWLEKHGTPLMRDATAWGFAVVYGTFWLAASAILLFKITRAGNLDLRAMPILLGVSMFFLAHWASYRMNKPSDERRLLDVNVFVLYPLLRSLLPLIALVWAVDFNAINSAVTIAVWMMLKTVVDVYFHIHEHSRAKPNKRPQRHPGVD